MAKNGAKDAAGGDAGAAESQRGFDEELAELERIVAELEQGGLGLEKAIERFGAGVALLGRCQAALSRYSKRVEELTGDAEKALANFADDPDFAADGGGAGSPAPRR